MKRNILGAMLASLALAATITSGTTLPAKADQASTTRLIAGAAAVAAIATAINVQHKHQVASTVVGYLSDGSTVYQDGRVVAANGQSWYPGNYGQQVACDSSQCYVAGSNGGYGYGTNVYSSGYNANNRYGSSRYSTTGNNRRNDANARSNRRDDFRGNGWQH